MDRQTARGWRFRFIPLQLSIPFFSDWHPPWDQRAEWNGPNGSRAKLQQNLTGMVTYRPVPRVSYNHTTFRKIVNTSDLLLHRSSKQCCTFSVLRNFTGAVNRSQHLAPPPEPSSPSLPHVSPCCRDWVCSDWLFWWTNTHPSASKDGTGKLS